MAIGLGSLDVPVPATVALVGMTWRFTRAVPVGSTVRSRWRLNRKRGVQRPGWGLTGWQVEVLGPGAEVCAIGEVTRLVARRAAVPVAHPARTEAPQTAEQVVQAGPVATAARGRRRGTAVPAGLPSAEIAPPDPAPADVPSPARRSRRRRRGGGGGGGGNGGVASGPTNGSSGPGVPVTAEPVAPAPPAAPVSAPAPPTPSVPPAPGGVDGTTPVKSPFRRALKRITG